MLKSGRVRCSSRLATFAKIFGEGIKINVFDRQVRRAGAIISPAPGGLAHALPIGRAITRAAKTFLLHERFHQHNLVRIELLPIVTEAARGLRQNPRGEIGDVEPRQNEKAMVVDEQ